MVAAQLTPLWLGSAVARPGPARFARRSVLFRRLLQQILAATYAEAPAYDNDCCPLLATDLREARHSADLCTDGGHVHSRRGRRICANLLDADGPWVAPGYTTHSSARDAVLWMDGVVFRANAPRLVGTRGSTSGGRRVWRRARDGNAVCRHGDNHPGNAARHRRWLRRGGQGVRNRLGHGDTALRRPLRRRARVHPRSR